MQGIERIKRAFEQAYLTQSAALMPYFTLGYPNREQSVAAVQAVAQYADLFELGVPFSDPIADGPTIQRSTQQALEAGTTVRNCLAMVRELRDSGMETPAVLMGYMNPIMAYGIEGFIRDARAAGVDGFIVPDLPPEESAEIEQLAAENGLAYIHFLAPTSTSERIQTVAERATGFIYMVSLTGVTGARTEVRVGLDEFVRDVRARATVPVAVGFGISDAEQAGQVGAFADGVIVGSALIEAFDAGGVAGSAEFTKSLRAGLTK